MATKKKAGKKAKKPAKTLASIAPAESMTLKEWLGAVDSHAKEAATAGAPIGACLITNPQTGTNVCILVDEKTCTSLKGTFIGGPCGS